MASVAAGEFGTPLAGQGELIYAGSTLLAGRQRRIECRRLDRGYLLRIAGAGRFTVERRSDGVAVTRSGAAEAGPVLTAAAVGPLLLLALALEGVWCLHASAVFDRRLAVAFVGASGAGKSTLARELERGRGWRWRRLADDLLPISVADSQPLALPRYPQLKLAGSEQPALSAPARLRLGAIYLLRQPASPACDKLRVAALRATEAVAALACGSFISFLLDRSLLARQLDLLSALVGEVPVRRLDFPHRSEAVTAVAACLDDDLASA